MGYGGILPLMQGGERLMGKQESGGVIFGDTFTWRVY
jgi:hypothetical protein